MTIDCTNCHKPVTMSGWFSDNRQVWVHFGGSPNCYPRNFSSDVKAVPSTETLDGWLAVFAKPAPGEKDPVVLDLDMDTWEGEVSPKIIVRHQGRVMILNPMALPDHLCIDAHAFVDGKDARTGVLAMDTGGVRTGLEPVSDGPNPFGTSHGWPAAALVGLLLGEQKDGSTE